MFIAIPVALLGIPVAIYGLTHIAPVFNNLLSYIWEDPSERQRKQTLERIKELHVDGNVHAETAVLMTAQEMGAEERDILDALGAVKPSEIKAVVTGRKTVPRMLLDNLISGLYGRTGGKRK